MVRVRAVRAILCVLVAALGLAAQRTGSPVQQAPAKYSTRVNPYEHDPAAIVAGRKLFLKNCMACHGRDAGGIGKAPPLVIPDVYRAAPGALFWAITNGSLNRGMPSYAYLPESQRWQIVTYLKSLGRQSPSKSP